MGVFDKYPLVEDLADTGKIGAYLGIESCLKGREYCNVLYAPLGFKGSFTTERFMNIPRTALKQVTLPDGSTRYYILIGSSGTAPNLEKILPEIRKEMKALTELAQDLLVKESLIQHNKEQIDKGTVQYIKDHAKVENITNHKRNRNLPEGYIPRGSEIDD